MTFHTIGGLDPAAPGVRRTIEDEIERLIAVLDVTDGDPDLEPNGDERDVCAPWGSLPGLVHMNEDDELSDHGGGDIVDEPHDEEREADDADAEPSEGGDFDGSGCSDDAAGEVAEIMELCRSLSPEQQSTALAYARLLASQTEERGQ